MAKAKVSKTLTGLNEKIEIQRRRLELQELKLQRKVTQARLTALSTFAAADKKHRTLRDWRPKTKTADQAMIPDSVTLNARARQAYRDDWTGKGIVGAYRRNVVGIGITPRCAARDPETGDPFTDYNRGMDALWYQWARNKRYCDVEGHRTFVGTQALAIQEMVTVGESLIFLVYEPRRAMVGLSLQMFEPEQLDTRKRRNDETGNRIVGGVEVNEFGRPLAFWIHTAQQVTNVWRATSVRIPVEAVSSWRQPQMTPLVQMLHLFRSDRVRQTRGVTWLTAVLKKIRHLAMYDEYQLIAARLEACIGGIIKRELGADNNAGLPLESGGTAKDVHGSDEIIMEPGMMPRLAPGEDIDFNTPTKPGGQYDPFVKAQVAQIGAGAGLDYASLLRDYSQGNFSSQRQGTLENNKEWDPLQLQVIDDIGRPTRDAFKIFAILEERVEAPGFFEDPVLQAAYLEDDWQGPPKPWVDPARQAKAAETAIKYRLTPRRSILGELGLAVEGVFQQIHDEEQQAGELGIFLPESQPKGAPAVAAPAPAVDGQLSEAIGEVVRLSLEEHLADFVLSMEA